MGVDEIRISNKERGINLNYNAPLKEIKVQRYSKPASSTLNYTQTWGVKINNGITEQPQTSNCKEAAKEESRKLYEQQLQKQQREYEYHQRLLNRLHECHQKKKKAVQVVIAKYHEQSMEMHAPHKNIKKKYNTIENESNLQKALSQEDLDLEFLPETRSYLVHNQEPYSFNRKYFNEPKTNATSLTYQNQLQNSEIDKSKDYEKQLRMCYRMGHLDQIKKQEFNKTYSETRHHYMELERYTFLEKQRQRKEMKMYKF
ncbi:hypothetical protein BC833DRAFT_608775 [Globomyces pollinis-pini]|nr:hypothetical protein BC833DRAFT_608775 [Globomyces pollinis-pini]